MTSDATAVLSGRPFFQEFLPRHLDKLLGLGSEVHFSKDQIIFPEGDESAVFYVILSGRVALESGPEGRNYRIQILYPGEELGWSSVLGRKKQFQARAMEPVEALAFEAPALREACANNPYFGAAFFERLLTAVAERLQITRAQLTAVLAGQSAETGAGKP
jgi:CRP-like cAMP-binding protein